MPVLIWKAKWLFRQSGCCSHTSSYSRLMFGGGLLVTYFLKHKSYNIMEVKQPVKKKRLYGTKAKQFRELTKQRMKANITF